MPSLSLKYENNILSLWFNTVDEKRSILDEHCGISTKDIISDKVLNNIIVLMETPYIKLKEGDKFNTHNCHQIPIKKLEENVDNMFLLIYGVCKGYINGNMILKEHGIDFFPESFKIINRNNIIDHLI